MKIRNLTRTATISCFLLASALGCPTVCAKSLFNQHSQHASFNLDFSNMLNKDYVGFGVGYSYFPLDGLETGLDFDLLLGSNPIVYKVSPQVRYVFHQFQTFIPYIGAFYHYNFIDNLDNRGGFGFRAGLNTQLWENAFIGYGVSFANLNQCDKNVYGACSEEKIELKFTLRY